MLNRKPFLDWEGFFCKKSDIFDNLSNEKENVS